MSDMAAKTAPPLPDSLQTTAAALAAADRLVEAAKDAVTARVVENDQIKGELLDRHQFAAHGFAWLATYVEGLRQLHGHIGGAAYCDGRRECNWRRFG